jgi:hypothetical protein
VFSRIDAHCKQHQLAIKACCIGFYGLQIHAANRFKADIRAALANHIDEETEFVLFPQNAMGVVFAAIGDLMFSLWMDKKAPAGISTPVASSPGKEAVAVRSQPGAVSSTV